ncbi:MAG: phosphodiester glycosidase family protein [Oscillospiraceae bacterium]|nr:phosphodiester glycosidase family protein [Oscillospiraceae bacterium]
MKRKLPSKIVSFALCVVMFVSLLPMSALAAWNNVVYNGTTFGTNGYYNVISKKEFTLVPGAATETEMVINNSAGNRRQVMHIIEVDPSNPDVSIVPGYYGIDKDLSDVNNHKVAGVTDVVKYYEDNLGYNVVGAMNTSLAYDSNAPIDFLVYNGVNLSQGAHHAQTFLAVIKDPDTGAVSCELHNYADGIPENCWQAVSANFGFTVRNGELVSKTEERTSSPAARSMLGVKEDGTLVIVMNDGRGANNSVGFCNYELGESMLALGCKWAVNCDGGGSSSFVTKRAGETANTIRCVPCDGAERPTINSILITSNVAPTGILDSVNITSDYDCFAPGTSYTFGAEAIDTHGYAMDMPAGASWALSDESFGTVTDGTFVSNGKLGEVEIRILSGEDVIGRKTVRVANPESLTLSATSTVLPYSTAEKPRSVILPIAAVIGEAPVYFDAGSFNVALSAPEAGTMNGLTFTATADETVPGTVITATYLPTGQQLTYTVTFGKGSEILWDFEDGDISNWYGGGDDVKVWLTENGVPAADQLKTLISGGQISFSEQSHTFLSTRDNGGQVHNGENALGVDFDFRNVEFNSWVYAILYNIQDQYVLRDVANGKKATALGMWCYVPEGFCNPAGDTSGALAMQLTVYKNPEGTSGSQLNFQFYSENQKKRVSLNQCTEADIPENRWVYLTADLTGSDYYSLTNPKGTTYREPSFFRMYIKPTRAQVLTYYFDDFTLDYSSAVDDRDAPVITNPTYCTADSNIELDGQTVNTNVVSFNANIADYAASNAEGLNYSSAAIYADGVKLDGVTASGNNMGVNNVTLSDGTHAIKFEIYDNAGNFSSVTKNITVDADASKAVVTVAGHNDKNIVPEYDSVYYVDLVASDIAQISGVTATLRLNTANTWELDHMIAAPGYEASYTYNDISKLAAVTVTKTGECSLTGQQILVSIPARVWSFDVSTDVGGDGTSAVHMTEAERFSSSYGEPKVFVDAGVVSGAIEYADNTSGTFGGSISVATKLTGNKSNGMWHQHTAEPAADKAATCLEAGYTGRTYCDVCGSVVDWGTDVPKSGHHYELTDGQFVCADCGDVYPAGTGLFELDGKTYYAIGGNLMKSWQDIDGNMYFFSNVNYAGLDGVVTLDGVEFAFDNGKLLHGTWLKDSNGTRYYYGPGYYKCTAGNPYANVAWAEIDGETYGFDRQGYRHEGIRLIVSSNDPGKLYEFTDDGILIGEYITNENGIFRCNGQTCFLIDGVPQATGLIEYDGNYYYINSGYVAVTGTYNCTHMNGLLPGGYYDFDEYGRMIQKNGPQDDGYFYIDGKIQKCYQLIEYEGDYYFINDGNKYSRNTRIYLSERFLEGTDFQVGYYDFDNTGKLIIKNGPQDDGYFYLNGARQSAYQLIEFEGNYYFISDAHKYAKSAHIYLSQKFIDGTPFTPGYYDFDAEGKLIIKNGPQDDGYFYLNAVRQQAYQLIQYEDNYYFVNDAHKLARNQRIYLSDKFVAGTDLAVGYYEFGDDYKLILKNGPQPDGYFYVNGARQNAYQLVEYEGNYYFINDSNKLAKDRRIYLSETFVAGTGLAVGYYDFDSEGRLQKINGPQADGSFYLDGVRQMAYQLVEYNGDYYFINDGNKLAKDRRIYLSARFVEGTEFAVGYYDFDSEGRLQKISGPQADGTFYLDGVRQMAYQLIKYDGSYYFIDDGNKYARNKRLYLSNTFIGDEPIEQGYYTFGEDGKIQGLLYYYNDQGEIEKDLGLILKDGYYYYVRTTGQLAVGRYKIDENKVNEFLKGDQYFNFDEQGRMMPPAYYIVGIRNARDIGLMDRMKTTGKQDVKSGLLIRGTELDGAINPVPLPADVQAYGVDLLKNTYHIKTEMDLRNPAEVQMSSVGLTDPLGEGVTHKYYNVPLYTGIFTDEGKAVIKSVFDDLCNPDNYPVYLHCTYGLDRTGVVCFLLEGALGVDEQSCVVEYCTTKGSHQPAIDAVRDVLREYPGSSFKQRVSNYLNSCGITNEQLETLRSIYLEG